MSAARIPLGLFATCFLLAACGHAVDASSSQIAPACASPAQWVVPLASGPKTQPANQILAGFANEQVVLLGEDHDDPEHHRWELSTIAGLHALRPQMVLGFEMFPRRIQPVLDQWVAGRLTEAEFLAKSDWHHVWGFEASLYMPIFEFARLHRIPMVALNVERGLASRVGEDGWAAVPAVEREGVTDPAPASREYLQSLYSSFLAHHTVGAPPSFESAAPTEAQLADPAFRRFVEGMLVWDRAMAEGIAARLHGADSPLVVAIMGSGHVRYGYGVAHQLRDLGVKRIAVALPWDPAAPCDDLAPGVADAVYALPPRPAGTRGERPRLGISIERIGQDVVVREVVQESVAAQAGLLKGDVIVKIAGETAQDTSDVIATVRRQAPGTWLPILIKRGDETLEIVARFPPRK
jgi:uncharacterized iron-regulated protein